MKRSGNRGKENTNETASEDERIGMRHFKKRNTQI